MADKMLNAFDVWITAQGVKSRTRLRSIDNISLEGVERLRKLILELSMSGKLVPQDASDEPAVILLARIAKAKEKLIKDGKIKKSETLPKVTKHETPFELPSGWAFARLGDLIEMYNGRAFKASEWESSGTPIIRIQNLNDPTAEFNYTNVVVEEKNQVNNGTLLISWSGTPGTSFGAFIWNRGFAALNQHINKCEIFGDEYDLEFLKAAINSKLDHLISNAQGGVGLKHVTKGTLNNLVIGIPPLSEQHRIVAKVDELMALCDALEQQETHHLKSHQLLVETLLGTLTRAADANEFQQAWKKLYEHFDDLFTTEDSIDQLKQTILQLAVMGKLVPQDPNDEPASLLLNKVAKEKSTLVESGKIKKHAKLVEISQDQILFNVPEGWQWGWFADQYFFQEGPGIRNWQFRTQGIKLLNVQNIVGNKLILDNTDKYIDEDEYKEKYLHFTLEENDLVFASSGGSWGKSAFFSDPGYKVIVNTSTIRIHPYISESSRFYLKCFLDSIFFKQQMEAQLVGMQPNFGSTHLLKVLVPIPPSGEQYRIGLKVDELFALCDRLKERIAEAQKVANQMADVVVETL